ncbi:MAG TPA: CpaD family pilus assembly lipoprotein [Rhizomicrobium sp.]|nr:CpaD family pilus assembly lipoprotein [Rhizomicrobium sp.]
MAMSDAMRAAAIAAVLLAGSCAAPMSNGIVQTDDPDMNHPIVVDTAPKTIRLAFSAADAGLMPEDAARFDAFVAQYQADGNGTINVTAPSGPAAQQTLSYFGERLAAAGIARSRIMVGTRNDGDAHVELSYVGYSAHAANCGDWSSQDGADMASNLPMPNLGCAVQHNIAAQLDNPRDIAEPRALGQSDAMRRATVMGAYEKGTPTAATKTADQSVAVSDVGH